MANHTKLEFAALEISDKNYLPWILDAEIHLIAKDLEKLLQRFASPQVRSKAMIFLCHHLHEDLKAEYLIVKDPLELWKSVKERYDHQKLVLLPNARYQCIHLRLQDFKSVSEYNSAMFRITSELCGEMVTEKRHVEENILYISWLEFSPAVAILRAEVSEVLRVNFMFVFIPVNS